jgi:hypothetical protein
MRVVARSWAASADAGALDQPSSWRVFRRHLTSDGQRAVWRVRSERDDLPKEANGWIPGTIPVDCVVERDAPRAGDIRSFAATQLSGDCGGPSRAVEYE